MIKSVGEIETVPDQATFRVSLYCLDKSVKASKNCLVLKSNELVKKLQSLGVKKIDILTTSVTMDKSYTWRNNSNVFEGYRSATSLIVTIKNIETLDEIYTELLENRNLELGGLEYNHSQIDSLKNEAYVQALKKSDVLADKLLEKLPEDDKEVLKIGNVEIKASIPQTRNNYDGYKTEEAVAVSNQSIGINTGTIRIDATLYVEYQIK
ncbi:MAG: SIMPL domain-containing protein [Bacteroidota bacterium]